MRTWATLAGFLWLAAGCASKDVPLGCAELTVTCPSGSPEQQWWSTKAPSSSDHMIPQEGQCGTWLAFIEDGASARFDDLDLGTRPGESRLRVLVAASDTQGTGGTLKLFADSDLTTPVASCQVPLTGGWFNWLVVDCGPLALTGLHTLTFKFFGPATGTTKYVFNFAAFGIARSGAPDCTVLGPSAPP